MVSDCIDPETRGFLCDTMKGSIAENVAHYGGKYTFGELWVAGSHWNSCPACRREFTDVPVVFSRIGCGVAENFRGVLSSCKKEFLRQKQSILASTDDLGSAYSGIIALLAMAEDNMSSYLLHGQEVLSLTTARKQGFDPRWNGQPVLSFCREYICSLEPTLQQFVYAATLSCDLLVPVWAKIDAEHAETHRGVPYDDFRQRLQTAIVSSELQPHALLQTIELAAVACTVAYSGDDLKDTLSTIAAQRGPSQGSLAPQGVTELLRVIQEMRQHVDDAHDSLKAGQMELGRLFEHNRRAAAHYEPYIVEQLGAPLYSRLHQTTQRAIQVAEYLYNINQEPDGFAPAALRMAQGYENELMLRIVWPFVDELLAAGKQTYDAQGKSEKPLIRYGKVCDRGMTLGVLAWYLGKDRLMRDKVWGLGLDPEAISKDAAWVGAVRNKAAHDVDFDRSVADELRRRILCRGSILGRLHPMGIASTAKD